MRQTLAKIETRLDHCPRASGAKLTKLIAPHSSGNRNTSSAGSATAALDGLAHARKFFAACSGHRRTHLDHLVEGLERSYRKARRRPFVSLRQTPSDEAFHAWRKAMQQHWRHMQLLSRGLARCAGRPGRRSQGAVAPARRGSRYSVLVAFAKEQGNQRLSREDLRIPRDRCRSRQDELRALAKPRGDRLFAEGDQRFKNRIALYWSRGLQSDLSPAASPKRRRVQLRRRRQSGRDVSRAMPQRLFPRRRHGVRRRHFTSRSTAQVATAVSTVRASIRGRPCARSWRRAGR